MMPKRFLMLRHGESEGNLANRLNEEGRSSEIPEELKLVHSWKWRLTERGREQAQKAGDWIRLNIPDITRGFVSPYIRAKETAALLKLPNVRWRENYYIRERDWGDLEYFPGDSEIDLYNKARILRRQDRMFWTPPNGASLAATMIEFDRFLGTLHRECENDSVIAVMHGESILVAMAMLERWTPSKLEEFANVHDKVSRIGNCHLIEYSRINPQTGEETDHLDYVRVLSAWNPPNDSDNLWRKIERPYFDSDLLAKEVEMFPTFFPQGNPDQWPT